MLTEMDVMDSFAADLRVPAVDSLQALDFVLRDIDLFTSAEESREAITLLQEAGFCEANRINIGVKKLLSLAEMCRQDPESRGGTLVTKLLEHRAL